MAAFEDINDLMAFLDISESVQSSAQQQQQLKPVRAQPVQRPPIKATSVNDRLALMKLAVENSATIEERIRDISASLKRDQQDVVHYRLPQELALSNLK